ncbi:polyadenylate-binding protein 3 isoform X1 [Herrania umbratica]|uniref:Polyadenylate-binding protein n=1 Tax=Herrania umbratica TaxID=108875 RepID=A0A6J1AED0_9ROSI|nr:polyadenylate-binding protein 3 isoform X1 [Herrania umbratica]
MATTTTAMAAETVQTGSVAAGSGFMNVSLYVGDLEQNVVEGQLYDLFSQVGTVVSLKVCRDQNKRSSLGYAYVNYSNHQEAAHAKEIFNFTLINGKPIRIMFSQRDPSIRKTGYANVFIKNLDPAIDNKALFDTFAAFGTVLSSKVATDNNGQSKGFGYVQFETEEAAQNAIKRLNGMLINDKQVYVGQHVRRQERVPPNASPKFNNVYVKNLSETITDEDLKKAFGACGTITSAVVMKDQNGKSRCFGFVNFQSPDAAAAAVEKFNGTKNDDKMWYVGRAQRKAEREAELKAKFEQERISRYEKLQAANLYLKNLDDSIDIEKLKEIFSEFGTITSCKIMLNPQGVSKGTGFVAFCTPEEASKALIGMNGKMIGKKPLYVAVAQRKEERKARLQAYFAQLHTHGAMSPLASGIPGFHPAAHRLGPQQLYYGQGGPGLINPQSARYGFQQQLLPGIRPSVTQNYIMPYNLQRQGPSGQRMGVRRGGNSQQMQQQQMLHRNNNQGFRYMGNARDIVDPSTVTQSIVGPVMELPFEVSRMPVNPIDVQQPNRVPISTLISDLASASPKKRDEMLGEQLYPLVQRFEPEHAGKVTGMLLEMDQTEVLHLLESPDALKEKVAKAMAVLQDSAAGESGVRKESGVIGTD